MKVVVILSGGMDSAVVLYEHVVARRDEVRCISIDYGQRHNREIFHARQIANRLNVSHIIVDLAGLASVLPGSSQTDRNVSVPYGHYAEETMKKTVVANRNMILFSVAIGHAVAHKFDAVSYGAHAGDHAIYPDCRPEFVDAMRVAAKLCDWHPVQIISPYIDKTKADIVKRGAELGLNFDMTWSCYEGGDRHCGQCGTCVERKEAFQLAGVVDPTIYRARVNG